MAPFVQMILWDPRRIWENLIRAVWNMATPVQTGRCEQRTKLNTFQFRQLHFSQKGISVSIVSWVSNSRQEYIWDSRVVLFIPVDFCHCAFRVQPCVFFGQPLKKLAHHWALLFSQNFSYEQTHEAYLFAFVFANLKKKWSYKYPNLQWWSELLHLLILHNTFMQQSLRKVKEVL